MKLKVPTLAIVIGEGGSMGRLLASSSKVIMLENAIYSVLLRDVQQYYGEIKKNA